MRKTKIICTIGPKTASYEMLKKMSDTGMNIARLNMSHADHDWHAGIIRSIKTINKKNGLHSISTLLDTKGPEIRSGDLRKPLELKAGDEFVFTIRKESSYPDNWTEVSYDGFVKEVERDSVILIDGGIMSFLVKDKNETDIICQCVDGGTMKARRHLNIRGKSADLPVITDKDWQDIDFGIEQGVDFIALSFVRDEKAIIELRKYLAEKKSTIDIIAKIENTQSTQNLEKIVAAADAVMIARGDLGSELPIEEVPIWQDKIIDLCHSSGKPVIIATHLLESMIVYPTPTRAEVTDISVGVERRVDCLMLSGETAAGDYPLKSLEVMSRVSEYIENNHMGNKKEIVCAGEKTKNPKKEIAKSAAQIAGNIGARGIIVITRRGNTLSLMARYKPVSSIFAFTNLSHVRRKLNIYWGTTSFRIKFSSDPEKTIQRAIDLLVKHNYVSNGDNIVVVSDILVGGKFVDTVQIRNITN